MPINNPNPATYIYALAVPVDPENESRLGAFDSLVRHPAYISHTHHKVHDGDTYKFSVNSVLGNTQVLQVYLKPPDVSTPQKRVHLVADFFTNVGGTFTIVENLDYVSGGTSGIAYNRNRNSANVSELQQLYVGSTGTSVVNTSGASSATILTIQFGADKVYGGQSRDLEEWVLAPNKGYRFQIVSAGDSNTTNLTLDWYEHTDE